MVDQAKRFEIAILGLLQIAFLVVAFVRLLKGLWWWLVGCVGRVSYLGIIGSKLQPLQSTIVLAQGPIEGPTARIESEILPAEVKQMFVGHACTRTGILLGIAGGIASWAALGLAWYFARPVASVVIPLVGVLLKLSFRAA